MDSDDLLEAPDESNVRVPFGLLLTTLAKWKYVLFACALFISRWITTLIPRFGEASLSPEERLERFFMLRKWHHHMLLTLLQVTPDIFHILPFFSLRCCLQARIRGFLTRVHFKRVRRYQRRVSLKTGEEKANEQN